MSMGVCDQQIDCVLAMTGKYHSMLIAPQGRFGIDALTQMLKK